MVYKQATFNSNASQFAEAAMAASRQVWLAGLGAASLARNWARNEAGHAFHSLVRQGSSVERRAIQVVGSRAETSIATAATLLRQTRTTAMNTARALAETASVLIPALKRPGSVRPAAARKGKQVRKAATKVAVKTRAVRPGRVPRTTKKARRSS